VLRLTASFASVIDAGPVLDRSTIRAFLHARIVFSFTLGVGSLQVVLGSTHIARIHKIRGDQKNKNLDSIVEYQSSIKPALRNIAHDPLV
jgi:hypothetical protein